MPSYSGGEPTHEGSRVDANGYAIGELQPVQLVTVVQPSRLLRRRSSSLDASQSSPSSSPKAVPKAQPNLIAGDPHTRPHYLKERFATMRDTHSPTMLQSATGVQSKASTVLVGLVDKFHGKGGQPLDGKATHPNQTHWSHKNQLLGANSRPSTSPNIEGGLHGHSAHTMLFHQQNPGVKAPTHHGILGQPSEIDDGDDSDDDDYATDQELKTKTPKDLVRDLRLFKRRGATLVRILKELHRRLLLAEMEHGSRGTMTLCSELVDDDIFPCVVAVMREFRFHVELQTAAIAVLSFLADVSDLYAYMMVELDMEPLVQKIVSVHVSQERLVMAGSCLYHAIAESKYKPDVVRMYKTRQAEQEKKRAATFSEAFVAGLNASKAKMIQEGEALRTSSSSQALRSHEDSRDDQRLQEWQHHRPASRSQRNMLSAKLGAPPMLTAHYDLQLPPGARRSTAIPPLSSASNRRTVADEEDEELRLDDAALQRPSTSPQARTAKTSRPPTVTNLAAIYSFSPVLVAPSPLEKRMNVFPSRKMMQSAAQRKPRKSRGGEKAGSAKTACSSSGQIERGPRIEHVAAKEGEVDHRIPSYHQVNGSQQALDTGDKQSDSAYDLDDDFAAADEADQGNDGEGTLSSRTRLMPVDSDSELLELVVDDAASRLASQETGRLLPVDSDSELLAMVVTHDGCGDGRTTEREESALPQAKASSSSKRSQADNATIELVDLLTTCVDQENPNAVATVLTSPPHAIKKVHKKHQQLPLAASPMVASWTPPSTIVRPVSRRIMDKTKQATPNKATRQREPSLPSDSTTAQITSVLMQIDSLNSGETEPAEPPLISALESPQYSSPPTATATTHPLLTPTPSVSQIQTLYARGLQHHKANELDAAIRCYEQGIALQQQNPASRAFASLYINLGSAKMVQLKLQDALAAFAEAERIQPLNSKAAFNSGLALMQLEQWGDAKAKFQRVLAMEPSHMRAHSGWEQCHSRIVGIQ